MTMDRVIKIMAGSFILISVVLAVWVSKWWLLWTAAVGVNLIQSALREVELTLAAQRPILDRFASELVRRDELDYDEIEAVFAEFGKVNPRRSYLTQGTEPPKV